METAISILTHKNILGNDAGKHANLYFNADCDTAREYEVCLRFKFLGSHLVLFGDTFHTSESPPDSSNKIYHLMCDGEPYHLLNCIDFKKLRYLQSNVYPNTLGLIFDGIEKWEDNYWKPLLSSEIPKKPNIFIFWDRAKKERAYKLTMENKKKQHQLIELSTCCINAPINIIT